MDFDVYLTGLVHFVNHEKDDEDPEVFMKKVRKRFARHVSVDLSSFSDKTTVTVNSLQLVELIEETVSTGESCLVECKIGGTLNSTEFAKLFSIVDVVQRIVHHHKVSGDKLKLFITGFDNYDSGG